MKERPILFSGPMVRAILEGRKTQTRRVIKGVESFDSIPSEIQEDLELRGYQELIEGNLVPPCKYGQTGDRLWVRERGWLSPNKKGWIPHLENPNAPTFANTENKYCACPSIHMPRWASRITLEITNIRVERLQDISVVDAVAEGIPNGVLYDWMSLWKSIHGPESWDSNPWIWVIEFKRINKEERS